MAAFEEREIQPVTQEEAARAVRKRKRGKSVVPDSIPMEV